MKSTSAASSREARAAWGAGRPESVRRRKPKGQFFTPAEAVEFMFDLAGDAGSGAVIDPACGDGAFVAAALARGFRFVVGVDVDADALAACRERVGPAAVLLEQDGLAPLPPRAAPRGGFDLVIGNPPFNALRHGVAEPQVLEQFELGRYADGRVRKRQRAEVLFLERFIQLARPGGAVCLIVPDGLLANASLRYVREFILRSAAVRAVVSLPRNAFRASGAAVKTSVLFLRKGPARTDEPALLAEAKRLEDLPGLLRSFRGGRKG